MKKHSSESDTSAPDSPKHDQKERPRFSFEERFKAYIGQKVEDNIEILQEKRRMEFNARVNGMLYGDIDADLSNAEFRQNIDPLNSSNMLLELTHQFVHQAIKVGAKKRKGAPE